jgi:hypothetical protein
MGEVAFAYYLQAFRNYLVSEASREDYDVSAAVDMVFNLRQQRGEIGSARELVLECLDYVLANFDKFDLEDTVQPSLKELLSELEADETVQKQMEEMLLQCGGNPEELKDLWKNAHGLAKPEDDRPEDKLPTIERWKALRKTIAES